MNKVDTLLENPFSLLKQKEKLEIKRLGVYQPRDVRITQQDGKTTRTFHIIWFDKKPWLTVSEVKKSLFCFYCLLFGGEDIWTQTGCRDLKHLSERIQKHESSQIHINNTVQFIMFGKENILSPIDRISIKKHNELVDKNRHTLLRIIDCIKFCGVHELLLRGHDETADSNHGVFLDLVSYTATLDNVLGDHLNNFTSKTNQNELLDCIYQVYIDEIRNELNNANFVSVQVDETTDVACRSQFVIILRYVKDSQPVERFLTFVDIHDRTTNGLANVLKEELEPFNLNKKLIAQAYNGTAVMNGSRNEIQMKEFYPHVHYIHCYPHQLNLILKKVCSSNKQIRIFFSTVSGIGDFFTCTKRNELFRKVSQCEIQWNFHFKIINCIKDNKKDLLECFNRILSEEDWDDKSVWESVGFKKSLEDAEFNFFLSFFYTMLKHVDVLYTVLQSDKSNNINCEQALKEFELSINDMQDCIEDFIPQPVAVNNEEIPPVKIKKLKISNPAIDILVEDAKEACTKIIDEMNDRFSNFNILLSFVIVDPKHFHFHRQNFPFDYIYTLTTNYPMLNEEKLISELTVMYENKNFTDIPNVNALSQFMNDYKLLDAFSEVSKLIEIVLVTPVFTDHAENSFNTLKRIKTLLRNSTTQDSLNGLAILSVHKDDCLQEILQFNQKVIEKFALMKQTYLYK